MELVDKSHLHHIHSTIHRMSFDSKVSSDLYDMLIHIYASHSSTYTYILMGIHDQSL